MNFLPKMRTVLACVAIVAAMNNGLHQAPANEPPSAPFVAPPANDILVRGRHDNPILVYRSVESPQKPYVRELYSPAGVQVLRDSPDDHKHHHGLMFAVAADRVDFWSETPGCGQQKSRIVEGPKACEQNGITRSCIRQRLDWLAADGQQLAVERRTIEAYASKDLPCTLITWKTQLEAAGGRSTVELTGRHYFGLGLRFVASMDKDGRFFNSEKAEGESIRGSERLTTAKWCAYTASADGKPVTVAIFDFPKNVRTARMFTMTTPFAYLGATINLWKEPLKLKAAAPLTLRYGLAVWDGSVTPEQVESAYRRWLSFED